MWAQFVIWVLLAREPVYVCLGGGANCSEENHSIFLVNAANIQVNEYYIINDS